MKPHFISLIITTYNRPDALLKVIQALMAQRTQCPFEVIIADDGSTEATADMLRTLQPTLPFPLRHCWQVDLGFRAAQCRNRAVASAQGEYLIFLDGDCLPFPDFVKRHVELARPNYFVPGSRLLLSQHCTEAVLQNNWLPTHWRKKRWFAARYRGDVNRLLPLIRINSETWFRYLKPRSWVTTRTCNLGLWRSDFLKVNGFDEAFQGWGHEDADLAVRLIQAQVYHKSGRFAVPVLHLWHPEQDRSQEAQNRERLLVHLKGRHFRAEQGIAQYLRA